MSDVKTFMKTQKRYIEATTVSMEEAIENMKVKKEGGNDE